MDIGIDLGTTYSVIAVKGRVQAAGDYPAAQYLPECDVSIIPSPLGEFAIPSAYWRNPADPHDFKVGSEAKNVACQGESPILFSKRKIGTAELFRIGSATFTAKDVATEMLKYLKHCAEKYLGQTVRRAVVTHPAYFDRNQVEETRQAAMAAGFDMTNDDEQMIMEPVAAALSFIHADPRDPLRILIYDLGGGTFDVTVLERREGVPTMLAFDGDPLLGGYNFDRAFVQWLLRRVREGIRDSGRSLSLDPEGRVEDMSRWSQLLQLAERVKEELTRKRTDKMPVTIKAGDILVDDDGKPILIQDRITREEYANIGAESRDGEGDNGPEVLKIPDFIAATIERSRRAIEKARLAEKDIHVMVLVGGSTHGQWIQEAMKKAFSCEVDVHYSPDLCVAAGAALHAASLPPIATGCGEQIEIVPDVSSVSPNPVITVTGTVRRDDGSELDAKSLTSLDVLLHTPDSGHVGPAKPGEGGVVMFEDIVLLDDEPSHLRFEVIDDRGAAVCERAFDVLYKPDSDDTNVLAIMPAVPKPLYLRTASGLVLIADEGEQLPTKPRRIDLEQLHDENSLELDVFQGDHKVGTIELKDLPEGVGAGSAVVIEVKITKRNIMQGLVKVLRKQTDVPSGTGALVPLANVDEDSRVAARKPVKISFPPLVIPPLADLETMLKHLDARRLELMDPQITPDDERRSQLGGLGGKLVRRMRALLAEECKDRQEIYQGVRSLERLLSAPIDAMEPSLADFEVHLRDVRRTIAESAEGGAVASWSERVNRIEAGGRDAYIKRNRKLWGRAFEQLKQLADEMQNDDAPPPPPPPLPATKVLKAHALVQEIEPLEAQYRNQLAALRHDAAFEQKFKAKGIKIRRQIDALVAQIKAISDDIEPRQALMSIQSVVQAERAKIEKKIREWPYAVKVR